MKNLKTQITKASTEKELTNLVKSMPNQENGFPTKLQRILEDAFWYSDLETLECKKNWMLKRI